MGKMTQASCRCLQVGDPWSLQLYVATGYQFLAAPPSPFAKGEGIRPVLGWWAPVVALAAPFALALPPGPQSTFMTAPTYLPQCIHDVRMWVAMLDRRRGSPLLHRGSRQFRSQWREGRIARESGHYFLDRRRVALSESSVCCDVGRGQIDRLMRCGPDGRF